MNVKQGLLTEFNKVVAAVTDEKALGKVECQLANAGLIVSGRVDVVLRDQIMGIFGR